MLRRFSKLLIISCVLMVFYLGVFHSTGTEVFLKVTREESGAVKVCLIEQKGSILGELPGRYLLGGSPKLRGEEYQLLEVVQQEDHDELQEYLFLPGYLDLSEVYVVFAGEDIEVLFDDKRIAPGEAVAIGTLEQGLHTVSAGDVTMDFGVMQGSRIPSVWIATEKGMDYVHDSMENDTAGQVRIIGEDGGKEYEGLVESLKGRGNSSWYMQKKSYGMKLTGQASLLGMAPGRGWVLQGGALDDTALRNKIFLDMAVECGLDNAVECRLVDLYIDDEYYGCYTLSEKVAVANGRLEIGDLEEKNLLLNEGNPESYGRYQSQDASMQKGYMFPENPSDITGGYLMEVETYMDRYHAETGGFITGNGIPVVIKAPGYASVEQVQYIADYVQQFENALYSPGGYNEAGHSYLEYIDLDSFAVRYLVDEVSKNIDAGYSSYFFYKPEGRNKMYAGPVWDYDTALGNNNGWGDDAVLQDPEGLFMNRANWSEKLWQQPEFAEAVKNIYEERFSPYLLKLTEEELEESVELVYDSVQMETVCMSKESPDEDFAQLRDFLEKRVKYLEQEFSK